MKVHAVRAISISRASVQLRGVIFVRFYSRHEFLEQGRRIVLLPDQVIWDTDIHINDREQHEIPRGQCQRIDLVCHAIPVRHRTRPNCVSRSVAS